MSISPESTDGEDITTDHHDQQENLGPTNLEPFEEMRLLLARITELDRQMNSQTSSSASFDLVAQNKNEKRRLLARLAQLEGQQTMNLPTSSDGFDFLTYDVNHVSLLATGLCLAKEELHQTNEKLKSAEESFDKKLEQQMEEVKRVSKLELENKVLRAEHEELSTAHKNLKEEMKEQREMDTLKQQTDKKETNDKIDSLKKEQFANIRGMEQKQKDGQEELQRKIDESLKSVQVMVVAELEKYQNKQQQNIDALTEKLKGSIDQFSLKYQELSNVHKKLMEEMKEQREMDALKQQKDQKETNDKIDSLKKDQEQSANNIRGMEQKQKDGQKELQRNIQAMVDAKLEEQKVSNANKFAEIEQKNDKLEKYQKEQSPNIVDLQKTIATLKEIGRLNRWDSAACHKDLTLSEPERFIVRGMGSVIAEKPMPGNPYFEVKILEKKGFVYIGLATKRMPLDKVVGWCEGTFAYASWGIFWGHEVAGCSQDTNGRPYIDGKPSFGVGDVVGCGVNLATRQIIYTKNGKRLDTANLFVDSAAVDLFPCVTLRNPGTKIEANFELFKYKF
ncbi:hypothetical protein GPALN_011757 [Globodera pallida]|nr:hypothetical protein GPALN_011757 [Globodera pallida]